MADQRQRDAYSLVIDLRGLGYHNTPPLHAIQKVRRGSGAPWCASYKLPTHYNHDVWALGGSLPHEVSKSTFSHTKHVYKVCRATAAGRSVVSCASSTPSAWGSSPSPCCSFPCCHTCGCVPRKYFPWRTLSCPLMHMSYIVYMAYLASLNVRAGLRISTLTHDIHGAPTLVNMNHPGTVLEIPFLQTPRE